MKKFIFRIIALFGIGAFMASLTGCGIDNHEHVYETWEIVEEATCQSQGLKEAVCTTCGHKASVKISKLDHKEKVVEKGFDATCNEPGLTDLIECEICKTVLQEQQEIQPLGHKWGAWQQSKDGSKKHYHVCENNPEHMEEEACIFDSVVTDATCTDDGYTTHTCQRCALEYESDHVDALGHEYADDAYKPLIEGGQEADSTHKHYHVRYCKRCTFEDKKECHLVEETKIEATCDAPGYTKYVCETCKVVHEADVVNPKGHELTYVHEEGTTKHYAKCTNCTYKGELEDCGYTVSVVDPTCKDKGYTLSICNTCNDQVKSDEKDALGCDWNEWVYDGDPTGLDKTKQTHSRTCKRNPEHKETGNCVMESATTEGNCQVPDTVKTTCKYCHISFTEEGTTSYQHKWQDWEIVDGKHQHTCEVCQTVESFEHNYTTQTTAPDCENPTTITYTCDDCDYSYTETKNDALGHDWNNWVITETSHKRTCKRNEDHVEEHTHTFTISNLCDECKYDCLVYTKQGAHYIVKGNNQLLTNVTEIIIPDTYLDCPVEVIGENAFQNLKGVRKIYIGKNVTEIGRLAFYYSRTLEEIEFAAESKLQIINDFAFAGCEKLNNVDLPNGLVEIGRQAFDECDSLANLVIPSTVVEIGTDAFENTAFVRDAHNWEGDALYINNHLLKVHPSFVGKFSVNIGTLVICSDAFNGCTSLTGIVLPQSLKQIDEDAFKGCEALETAEFNGTINEWLSIVFVNDYSSPLFYATNFHIDGAEGKVVLPETVKTIPAGTFKGTAIESIEIPESVTYIGFEAFKDCTNLQEIKIGKGVLYIGENAFANTAYYNNPEHWTDGILYIDSHLIKADNEKLIPVVDIKEGTTTIAVNAFNGCTNLKEVSIPTTLIRISAGAFKNCSSLVKVDFKDRNTPWFASASFGLGRHADSGWFNDVTGMARTIQFYDGEWRRY